MTQIICDDVNGLDVGLSIVIMTIGILIYAVLLKLCCECCINEYLNHKLKQI